MILTIKSIIASCIIFFSISCNSQNNQSEKKENKSTSTSLNIEEKWELPSILKEISGIVYMDENRFACVQDEDGKIFIYNTATSKIEKTMEFAPSGDYEGIALVGKNAYVSRSDGMIFEIMDWESENPQIKEHKTILTSENNIEGLCYDSQNNRLLIATKGKSSNNKDYKSIFSFDLTSKELTEEAVFKIDLTDPIFTKLNEKNQEDYILPSEVNIHPKTGDIYIIEGRKHKLLVMDKNGMIKALFKLDKKDFPQAEGIAFSPSGELFISNEGGKGQANILKLTALQL